MKAEYRILTNDRKIKYVGTEIGSWFTLEQAKKLVNVNNNETIYLYCLITMEKMWEILN